MTDACADVFADDRCRASASGELFAADFEKLDGVTVAVRAVQNFIAAKFYALDQHFILFRSFDCFFEILFRDF
jgi:hypothetical protein